MLAQHRVQKVPVPVNRPIQVAPLSCDLHVRFVEVPGHAPATATLLAELVGKEWSDAGLPLADRLVRDGEAADEEELSDVPQAQLVAEAPEHGVEDDVGRVLEVLKSVPVCSLKRRPQTKRA